MNEADYSVFKSGNVLRISKASSMAFIDEVSSAYLYSKAAVSATTIAS